jgi:RNA polymerase sigma factor (TIGR02999 family)
MSAEHDESPNEPRDDLGLTEAVYRQLRVIAQRKLSHEPPGHTLQATALVHEAYMRLSNSGGSPRAMDSQFYWAAASAMRRILIEHARAKKAVKRGGGVQRANWTASVSGVADLVEMANPEEFEALDRAIVRLQEKDSRAGDVVRLRFFAGLSLEEVAEALEISERSAKRDWEYARAWLQRELGGGASSGTP